MVFEFKNTCTFLNNNDKKRCAALYVLALSLTTSEGMSRLPTERRNARMDASVVRSGTSRIPHQILQIKQIHASMTAFSDTGPQ